MIGHLGARVSALLDGQLPPDEAEAAWNHVYACHACRDLVEREGWVKTRLAGLSGETPYVPDGLKGSLLSLPPGERFLVDPADPRGGRSGRRGVAVIGGSAVGAAMMGVLALGVAPASTPSPSPGGDQQLPASRIAGTPSPTAPPTAARRSTGSAPVGSAAVRSGTADPTAVPAWVRQLLP